MDNVKQWRCRNQHVLGLISSNGSKVPQLMLYRHAVDPTAERPAEVDLIVGEVIGRVPVRCDICDDVQLWDVSVDAMVEMFLSLRDEQVVQFQARVIRRQGRKDVKVYAAE